MTTLPSAIRTVRWMVRDTFRQSLATRLFWVMLGFTVLCVLVCASVRVSDAAERPVHPDELPLRIPKGDPDEARARAEGITVGGAEMSIGFGLMTLEVGRGRADQVRFLQLWFAGILADTVGVLLALVWTAGFLPTFLEPQQVTVLLAKPAPRWALVVGKYLGVVLFVGLQAVLFVGGTWAALGLATGVWDGVYWLAVPLLVVNFAVFYAFSAFLAVCTRSTVVAVFGTLLFWVLCWGMNFTHHRVVGYGLTGLSPAAGFLLAAGYWTLPKPLDLSAVFFDAMRADAFSMKVPEVAAMQQKGLHQPELAVASSLLFAAGILAIAAHEFRGMDY